MRFFEALPTVTGAPVWVVTSAVVVCMLKEPASAAEAFAPKTSSHIPSPLSVTELKCSGSTEKRTLLATSVGTLTKTVSPSLKAPRSAVYLTEKITVDPAE